MRRRWLVHAGLALLAPAIFSVPLVGQAPQTKPVRVHKVDYMLPPESLEGLWAAASAVVRVRIISGAPQALSRSSASPRVFTRNTAKLVEVFKSHPALGKPPDNVSIAQSTGEIDTGDEIIRVDGGFAPFAPGREYILFLEWNEGIGQFEVAFGPAGTLERDGERVVTPAKLGPLRGTNNTAANDVVVKLRQLR